MSKKVDTMKVSELNDAISKLKQVASRNEDTRVSGSKEDKATRLKRLLLHSEERSTAFLFDETNSERAGALIFHRGYCRNEHVVAQAKTFIALAGYMYPMFEHIAVYDHAPSHKKVDESRPVLGKITKADGGGSVKYKDTEFPAGTPFEMALDPPSGRSFYNKGMTTIGNERGHWDETGRLWNGTMDEGTGKVLTNPQMIEILAQDDDFKHTPSILEELFAEQPAFYFILNAKFWCSLQWVEQYWNDTKRDTREKCDYTVPTLKKNSSQSPFGRPARSGTCAVTWRGRSGTCLYCGRSAVMGILGSFPALTSSTSRTATPCESGATSMRPQSACGMSGAESRAHEGPRITPPVPARARRKSHPRAPPAAQAHRILSEPGEGAGWRGVCF